MNIKVGTYSSLSRRDGAPADLLCAALLLAGTLGALQATLSAFFFGDDYRVLDLSRVAASPFSFFPQNHFTGGYSYRPLPLALWWVVDRLNGNASAHYLTNLLLLGLCGAAFYALLRVYAYRRALCLALALLYVWHPVSVITTLWLSNIYDLVATAGMLGSMAAFARFGDTGRKRSAALALALFIAACFSKETAYIGPGIFLVQAVFARPHKEAKQSASIARRRYCFVAITAAVVLGMMALRASLGVSMGYANILNAKSLLAGVANFLGNLPRLIAYELLPRLSDPFLLALSAVAAVILGYIGWSSLHPRVRRVSAGAAREPMVHAPIAVGAAIVALCTVVQAPHTGAAEAILSTPTGTPSGYFYERFAFLALAGSLLALSGMAIGVLRYLGGFLDHRPRNDLPHWTVLGTVVILASLCLWRVQTSISGWVDTTQGPSKALFVAAASAARNYVSATPANAQPCQMLFLGTDKILFQFYAEPAIKALANDPFVDDCIILTEKQPEYTMSGPSADRLYSAPPEQQPGTYRKSVRFGQWLIIPEGTRVSRISEHDSIVFVYSPASGGFEHVPAGMRSGTVPP